MPAYLLLLEQEVQIWIDKAVIAERRFKCIPAGLSPEKYPLSVANKEEWRLLTIAYRRAALYMAGVALVAWQGYEDRHNPHLHH